MASAEQIRKAEQVAAEQSQLHVAYKALADNPAMLDLLKVLDDAAQQDYDTAVAEDINPARRAVYLQSSATYRMISVYLHDMFE